MNAILFIIIFFIPMPIWIKIILIILLGIDLLCPIISSDNGYNLHIFKINIVNKDEETKVRTK